ncbi:hypothetical protein CKN80_11000 [Carnobacterium divergens]|uniref:hypothetical protein n=1 Tax=Carnobacterium divergens TaxID=2748 RepID=UPI001071A156|nr:hypothetical protein [Carnobacterium divergens]TFJ43084.1 hypothetical protein CKN79_10995 [Carnobacterium divergens]TFJ50237.1 hypothetical protein CKN80_11000 [Carnobacterium divergens]
MLRKDRKNLRYQYGYYSFLMFIGLFFVSQFLTGIGFQWAETNRLETWILLLFSSFYFGVMTSWKGALGHEASIKKSMILFCYEYHSLRRNGNPL